MSLIPCPECEHEVSTKADHCPHCGFPITVKAPIENTYGIVTFIYVIMLAAGVALAYEGEWIGYLFIFISVVLLVAKYKLWEQINVKLK